MTTHDQRETQACALCDRPATDAHHVLHKGRGGDDHGHNRLWLCRQCHDAHHQSIIEIDQEAHDKGFVHVYNCKSGEVLCSRKLPDEHIAGDESATDAISGAIQRVEDAAEFGLDMLNLEQLCHVAESVETLTHAWSLRAEAIKRAYDGWLLWREEGQPETRKTYKLQAIAKRFQINPGTARQEYDVARTYEAEDGSFARHAMQSSVKDFSVWRAAAAKDDPWAALNAAQEITDTLENASVEQQLAAMETRATRQWWVRIPDNAMPGEWLLYKDLEREYR